MTIESVLTSTAVVLLALSPIIIGGFLGTLVNANIDGYRDAARGTWERDSKRGLARWAYMKGRAQYDRAQATIAQRHERRM